MKQGMEWPNLRATLYRQIAESGDARRFTKERTSEIVRKVLEDMETDGLIVLKEETAQCRLYALRADPLVRT